MPKKMQPRTSPIQLTHNDHILIGYEVILGDSDDQAYAHWLIAQEDGSFKRVRVPFDAPNANAFTNTVFNRTKGDLE